MEWKYKIWLLAIGAAFTIFVALDWNYYLAVALLSFYLVFFSLTIYRQFYRGGA
jgi:hypothetical protein|tara:strand:- start:478 stop:639 length:162 start_codon:yes stop_codon:yes gene_type:complete